MQVVAFAGSFYSTSLLRCLSRNDSCRVRVSRVILALASEVLQRQMWETGEEVRGQKDVVAFMVASVRDWPSAVCPSHAVLAVGPPVGSALALVYR